MRPAGEAEEEAPALPATKKMKKAGAQGEEPKESSEATMLMKKAGLTASGSSEASSSAAAPAQPGQPSNVASCNVVRLTEQEIAEDKDVVHPPIDSEEVRPPIVRDEPVFTPESPDGFDIGTDIGVRPEDDREDSSSSSDNPLTAEFNRQFQEFRQQEQERRDRDARLGFGPTFVSPALMQELAAAPIVSAPVHQPVPVPAAVPHDGEDTQEWVGLGELPDQAIEAGTEAEATVP